MSIPITADNGSEFVEHERVAAELEAQVYFAHPYSAWERGQNENSNGLLRQYVPKGSDLSVVTAEAMSAVEKRLNFRPRKCLGFKQPQVVFDELRKQPDFLIGNCTEVELRLSRQI